VENKAWASPAISLCAWHQSRSRVIDIRVDIFRVASMRQRVIAVAAANRHTVAVVEGGHVYSWGCNLQGQLGYGTSDSASNAVPRIVEAMKVS